MTEEYSRTREPISLPRIQLRNLKPLEDENGVDALFDMLDRAQEHRMLTNDDDLKVGGWVGGGGARERGRWGGAGRREVWIGAVVERRSIPHSVTRSICPRSIPHTSDRYSIGRQGGYWGGDGVGEGSET